MGGGKNRRIAERGKSGKVKRKQGGSTSRKIKSEGEEEKKRWKGGRESEALFSFHDVQCQIELKNLLFSVNLCFSFAMIIKLLTRTHRTYAHSYPPHTQA